MYLRLFLCTLCFIIHAVPPVVCCQQHVSYDQAQVTLIDNVKIAASDPGIVEEILITHGSNVGVGQIMVRLDAKLDTAQYQAAQSERKIAELQASNDVNYRFAEKSSEVNDKVLQRSKNARNRYRDSVSDTEIEQLELSLQQSNLSIEQAVLEKQVNELTVGLRSSQERVAEVRLANREIQSALDGQIVEIYVQRGEWVNSGQPVARIIDLSTLRVKAVYGAEYYQRINKNAKASFRILGDSDAELEAKIYFISPEIDPTNQDFQIWADVDNSDGLLLPGMKGELRIELR